MKSVYRFSGDVCDWKGTDEKEAKTILGGKGAALVKMVQSGLNVPPGFTYTTNVCHEMASPKKATLAGIQLGASINMKWLTEKFGYRPLVSVRSGAPVSMPGMMDTILNVGLNKSNIGDWCDRIGVRAAYDSYRRLIQMLGATAYGVDKKLFDEALESVKKAWKAEADADLDSDAIAALSGMYEDIFAKAVGKPFPQDPMEQLMAAISAVFNSWQNPRAIEYRKLNKIDPAMGTACTVQAMVFGNMGNDSGTGVLFTRNPSTGENLIMGEFLQNAQGEDVVAGIRTPVALQEMDKLPGAWKSILHKIAVTCIELEESYKDMVDIEFTVQKGELFILQSRSGKRSARAAFKIAHDLVESGMIDKETAMKRLTKDQYKIVRQPSIDPKFNMPAQYTGLPACPGVVSGKPVFSSQAAVESKEVCILVTHETTPDDIKGMNAAVGILTKTGGATSHAAVVARAMDKACVVGCTELDMQKLQQAKKVTIDGSTGKVWIDTEVPVIDSSDAPELRFFMNWALQAADVSETVTLDQEHSGKQTIAVSHWWGNKEIFESVLSNLEKMPSRSHITLDLRRPQAFDTEGMLHMAFGQWPKSGEKLGDEAFQAYMIGKLVAHKDVLKGVRLDAYSGCKPLADAGYSFTTEGSAPADYVMLSQLGV